MNTLTAVAQSFAFLRQQLDAMEAAVDNHLPMFDEDHHQDTWRSFAFWTNRYANMLTSNYALIAQERHQMNASAYTKLINIYNELKLQAERVANKIAPMRRECKQ